MPRLLYIKTNRRRGGFVENITMENVEATSTKFGVLGIETDVLYQWRTLVPTYEERLTPIRGITVRGRKHRYEDAVNVKETNVRIGTFIEAPDQENKNN